jgi:hypothetical protein
MSLRVDTVEMSLELPLSNNHKVTHRTLFRGGMLIVKMTIIGFPREECFVAEGALDPPLLIH